MTPEQLRALADDLQRGNSGRFRSEVVADAEAALRSAADEAERIRLSESNATRQRDDLTNALRRIENAPHEIHCVWTALRPQDRYCTCWKADAL
jgi:hypothetical protein